MTENSPEQLRDKLLAHVGSPVSDADVSSLLLELLNCGGSVTLELEEMRLKLVRREGRYTIKKEDLRRSSLPPRGLAR